MNDDVEEIKKRLDIVEFISGYLTLKKAGSNYKAPCPFHQEKTPSFMISPDKQIFKCFGCSESGDIFTFLMKMEGLNFPEAIEILANRAGVIIDRQKNKEVYQKEKDSKSRLYQINKIATDFYHKILSEHPSADFARQYLKKRSINNETIDLFKLGFAPQKLVLHDYLIKRGFSSLEIQSAGNPDRFKNRLMFPIFDQLGNTVGFTGRVLDPLDQPKYLNTPETPIFHKSRILYGLNFAKQFIKQQKSCLIVEGQMDVIASHQTGVKNVIATSGTALTQDHLGILDRFTSNIVFCFDRDLAGSNAAKKAIKMAISLGLNVKMIILPNEFKDAGEIVEKDAKLWQEISQKPVNYLEWLITDTMEHYQKEVFSGSEKKEISQEILPFIALISDPIEKEHYIKILAKKIDTDEKTIFEALSRVQTIGNPHQTNRKKINISPQENLVATLVIYPDLMKKAFEKLDYRDFSDQNMAIIYKVLQSCYTLNECPISGGKKNPDLADCTSKIIVDQCFAKKLNLELNQKIKALTIEIETLYQDLSPQEIEKEVINNINLVLEMKRNSLKDDFAKAIKEAESKGDISKVKALLKEFQNAIT